MLNKEKKHRIEKIGHYVTGTIVIIKGIDKSEHFSEHPFVTILLFMIGAFIITATYFHHFFAARVKEFKSILFFCEGCALLLVTYYYFEAGKKLLPYAYLIASIAFFIAAFLVYRKKAKQLRHLPAKTNSFLIQSVVSRKFIVPDRSLVNFFLSKYFVF